MSRGRGVEKQEEVRKAGRGLEDIHDGMVETETEMKEVFEIE